MANPDMVEFQHGVWYPIDKLPKNAVHYILVHQDTIIRARVWMPTTGVVGSRHDGTPIYDPKYGGYWLDGESGKSIETYDSCAKPTEWMRIPEPPEGAQPPRLNESS